MRTDEFESQCLASVTGASLANALACRIQHRLKGAAFHAAGFSLVGRQALLAKGTRT